MKAERRLVCGVLLLAVFVLAGCGAAAPLGTPGTTVTVQGTVRSVDVSEMVVDGPGRIVLATDEHGKVTVLVAACLGPCVLEAVRNMTAMEVGDRWQATGEVEGANSLIVYDETSHALSLLRSE